MLQVIVIGLISFIVAIFVVVLIVQNANKDHEKRIKLATSKDVYENLLGLLSVYGKVDDDSKLCIAEASYRLRGDWKNEDYKTIRCYPEEIYKIADIKSGNVSVKFEDINLHEKTMVSCGVKVSIPNPAAELLTEPPKKKIGIVNKGMAKVSSISKAVDTTMNHDLPPALIIIGNNKYDGVDQAILAAQEEKERGVEFVDLSLCKSGEEPINLIAKDIASKEVLTKNLPADKNSMVDLSNINIDHLRGKIIEEIKNTLPGVVDVKIKVDTAQLSEEPQKNQPKGE